MFNFHGLFFYRDADEEEEEDERHDNEDQQRKRQRVENSRGKRPASGRYVIGYSLVNGSIVIIIPVANIIWFNKCHGLLRYRNVKVKETKQRPNKEQKDGNHGRTTRISARRSDGYRGTTMKRREVTRYVWLVCSGSVTIDQLHTQSYRDGKAFLVPGESLEW